MFNRHQKVIYKNGDITLTEFSFPNASFLDNIFYEDKDICFTSDKLTLAHRSSMLSKENNNKIIDLNSVSDEQIIDTVLFLADINKKQYEKYQAEGDIFRATIFCDKRDRTVMFYKLLNNKAFTWKSLYEYAVDSYSLIEDSYGYDLLANGMKICIINDDSIKEDIINSLKDKIVDDKVIVYRGENDKNRKQKGISYTFNKKIAEFFANRWSSNGVVKKYEIKIDDILAYIEKEDEIVSQYARKIR